MYNSDMEEYGLTFSLPPQVLVRVSQINIQLWSFMPHQCSVFYYQLSVYID